MRLEGKGEVGFRFYKEKFTASLETRGVKVTMVTGLITAASGKLKMETRSCGATIGELRVEFSGGALSAIANWFRGWIADKLKVNSGVLQYRGLGTVEKTMNDPFSENIERQAVQRNHWGHREQSESLARVGGPFYPSQRRYGSEAGN